MTSRQLLLDLAADQGLSRADFLPSPCNEAGLAAVDQWQDWPNHACLLCGPAGSGRSHLGHIWASETNAIILKGDMLDTLPETATAYFIDDADHVAGDAAREESLFHLYNHAKANGAALLMTAPDAPGTWGIQLPDLLSRMQTLMITRIHSPDDQLLHMALVKLFDDRQLSVSAETITYLLRRIDRSLRAAVQIVESLDHAALSRQKRISRAMAAEILQDMHSIPPLDNDDPKDEPII